MQILIIRIGCSARLRVCALGCRRPGFMHHVHWFIDVKLWQIRWTRFQLFPLGEDSLCALGCMRAG